MAAQRFSLGGAIVKNCTDAQRGQGENGHKLSQGLGIGGLQTKR